MRRFRRLLNYALPILGMCVAFAGVLFVDGDVGTLLTVLAGILLVEAGVWNLANPFLPSARKYTSLRTEVDEFIQLVRGLNTAAIGVREIGGETERESFRESLLRMHASVDRMGELAGVADQEEEAPPAP